MAQVHYNIETREAVERSLELSWTPKAGSGTGEREEINYTGYFEDLVAQAREVVGAAKGGSRAVSAHVSRIDALMGELRVVYEEYEPDGGDGDGSSGDDEAGDDEAGDDVGTADNPSYTMSSSTYEASILTHPKFANIGSPAADALKALIDGAQLSDPMTYGGATRTVEDFLGGARAVYDRYISRGVTSYLEVSTEATARWRGKSGGYSAQSICHPPGSIRTPSGRNWLCTGSGQEESGGVVWQTASFRLSGPGGWDNYLYS